MESGDIGEIGKEKIGKLSIISIDSKGEINIPQEGIEIETTAIFNKDDQVKLEFGNEYARVLYDNGESVIKALDFARSLKGHNPLDIASQINDWISERSLLADYPGEIQKLRDPSSPTYKPELADWVENNITRDTELPQPTETNTQKPVKLSEIMTKTNKDGKFYSVCKHTALLGTAMLQEAGIPAWIQAGVHTLTADGQQGLHAWIVFLNENRQLVGLDPSSRTEDGKGILSTNSPEIFDNFSAFVNSPNSSFKFDDSRTLFSIKKEFENSDLKGSIKALAEQSKLKLRIIPNKLFKGILSGKIEGGVSYNPHHPNFPYKIASIDKAPDNIPLEINFQNTT